MIPKVDDESLYSRGVDGDFHRVNGEFRTDDFAVMAIHAVIRFLDSGGVIALLVESVRKLKNLSRTKLNTIPTSFAAIFEDMDHTSGNLNIFCIKRNTPKCHDTFLELNQKVKFC